MKKNIVLILILLGINFIGFAQKSPVKFHKMIHDFGLIKEESGENTFVFKFRNHSDKNVTIQNVTASCGCTTPSWIQHEITPKDSGFVKAIFDATNRPGPFEKKLTVFLATDNKVDTLYLTIKGNVKPKFKAPNTDFPDKIGGIRISSRYINLDKINDKDLVVKEYGIYNDTTFNLTLKVLNPQPNYMTITVEPSLKYPTSSPFFNSIGFSHRVVFGFLGLIRSPCQAVPIQPTMVAPTITMTIGPCAVSKWSTKRSFSVKISGIFSVVNG